MVAITVVLVASVRSCQINPTQAFDISLGLRIGFCLEKLWGISWQLDALAIHHCGYYESLAAAPACGHQKAAIFKLSCPATLAVRGRLARLPYDACRKFGVSFWRSQ